MPTPTITPSVTYDADGNPKGVWQIPNKAGKIVTFPIEGAGGSGGGGGSGAFDYGLVAEVAGGSTPQDMGSVTGAAGA